MFAAYVDESGNDRTPPERVVVAAAMATAENWLDFETHWRLILERARERRGFTDFHAHKEDLIQTLLNQALSHLMVLTNIRGYAVTLHAEDYLAVTTAVERSHLGNAFGFASFACVTLVADLFQKTAEGSAAGFYVEHGGPGYAKTMQLLDEIYRDEQWRRRMGLATFAAVNRQEHLPVHPADMLAHEVFSSPGNSVPLAVLGDLVTVRTIGRKLLREIVDEYAVIWSRVRREKSRQRVARRNARRRPSDA